MSLAPRQPLHVLPWIAVEYVRSDQQLWDFYNSFIRLYINFSYPVNTIELAEPLRVPNNDHPRVVHLIMVASIAPLFPSVKHVTVHNHYF